MTTPGDTPDGRPVIALSALSPAQTDGVRLSVNHDRRPIRVRALVCVVLHATADEGDEESAERWLCDAGSHVSAHLHIRRDGRIVRVVDDHLRAWHAGRSEWHGTPNVNDFSLGWELANRNDGHEPFSAGQYAAVARLAAHYANQGMPISAFVGHAEVAVPRGRKTDPARFEWPRFRSDVARLTSGSQPIKMKGD